MMDAREFENTANQLYSLDLKCEGNRRTIVGRWYYCIYHEVKYWLEQTFSINFDDIDGRTHEKLTICCRQLQRAKMDLELSKLGRLINELKGQRVHADYFLDEPFRNFELEKAKLKFDEINDQLNLLKSKYPN